MDLSLHLALVLQRLAVALEMKASFSAIQALLNKSPYPYLNSLKLFFLKPTQWEKYHSVNPTSQYAMLREIKLTWHGACNRVGFQ